MMLSQKFHRIAISIVCLLGLAQTAAAYELGPLIDLLVRKGTITQQEAEELRAELAMEFAETPAGKLEVADDVKQFEIKSDARFRYQYEDVQKAGSDHREERSRWRYRVKVGAYYHFTNGWNAGVQLETSDSADSTNTDFGGYFDKNGDDLFLGQIYLDYSNPHDWADLVNLTFGKKKHPFLIDGAFWDSDIKPEGFTQQLGWRQAGDSWFTLRAGQYLIDEAKESTGDDARDDWLFVLQAEYQLHLGRKHDLRIAPMILAETGGSTDSDSAEGGNTPNNENAIDTFKDLFVVSLPVDYTFLWNDIPQKLYFTVGYNLQAEDALNRIGGDYRPSLAADDRHLSGQGLFYNFGYRYGATKHFKDWQVALEYRVLQAAAMTPNLTDSDFGKNSLNQQGWILSGAYMISESVRLGATYLRTEAIEDDWVSAAADKDEVDLLQLDLSAKF